MTRLGDPALTLAMGLLGWVAGFLFTPGTRWPLLGAAIGLLVGWLAGRAGVRPAIGTVITAGGVAGAWIGREVVRALCLPGACTAVEVAGAVLSGLGSLFGIGLVVALVVRSFDEYYQRRSGL